MNTQETKAVEDAAVNQNTYVESEVVDAFIAGAQFLDELRKPSKPDKDLLEAAKDALRTFYGIGCNEEAEIVQVLTKAILNYEKQSK